MTTALPLSLITDHPLFGLALTIGTYLAAMRVHAGLGRPPLLHPVLTSVAVVALVIWATGMDYAQYFAQAAALHYALGVLVVLLAVKLLRQWHNLRAAGSALPLALLFGSIVAIALAASFPIGLGADAAMIASLTPKSATTAVAIGISERIGGIAALTAMITVLTGIFGAVAGPGLLAAAGVRDERAVGFAMGVASHAIGTARAFQVSETAGAFASIGMVLNAILTVVLVPAIMFSNPDRRDVRGLMLGCARSEA
jgi:putative effector of murein hydrolase